MESLLSRQLALGEEIERTVRNYKKDSAERKDAKYLQTKSEQIGTLWKEFQQNNEVLKTVAEEFGEVDYFKSNYFQEVKSLAEKLMENINLLRHSKAEGINPKVKVVQQSIRCEEIMLQTLRNLLERTEDRLKSDQPQDYKDCQLHAIKQHWEAIRSKHFQIMETSDISEGYDPTVYNNTESWVETIQLQLMTTTKTSQPAQSNIKLPRIELPKFDGNYLAWQEFHDLFSQLIDKNALAPAQKLWFLKTNLTGEAEALIRHLSICDSNYEAAWNLVKERYENKRLLVNAVLNKLISQRNLIGESAQEIKTLHDVTQECVRGLEALEIQVNNWDPILVFLLVKKLDKVTHILFEQSLVVPREIPTIHQFLKFLELRFQSLEALGNKIRPQPKASTTQHKTSLATTKSEESGCIICKGDHKIYYCDDFLKLSIPARRNLISKKHLCFNCFKTGHGSKTCKSRSCTKCEKKHNTLLHLEKNSTVTSANTTLTTLSDQGRSYVFLGTAVVNILDGHGTRHSARVLIDSGSQLSFITDKLYKKLHVGYTRDMQDIAGVGNSRQQSSKRVNLTMSSKCTSFSTQFEAFVLKDITSKHPDRRIEVTNWPIPKNLALADPCFNIPQHIDLLLGAELFGAIMIPGTISLGEQLPNLHNTVFGWMVLGKAKESLAETKICGVSRNLDQQLQRFWEIEEAGPSSVTTNTEEDKECEKFFMATATRSSTGRYIVRLPFQESPNCLGMSKQIALQRLSALQRRFLRNPELQNDYTAFIEEYRKLGHLELINEVDECKPHYYLPHHCVLRPESKTTKLRVVFDGSAKTSSNKSLNDILHTGPILQHNLFNILLRFRCHKYVITADIEKMYRQIIVAPEDRNFQLILWQNKPGGDIQTYRLKTVTYGTRSAPYLAIRSLNQLALDEGALYPLAKKTVQQDFYVDDLLTGCDSLKATSALQQQIINLLQKGGFQLRKWCSNNPTLLKSIPPEDKATEVDISKVESENVIKALGLTWNPSTDKFLIKINQSNSEKQITKRTVLSEMSQLFDPLGLVNPVIVLAKIFMQQLWEIKLDWDTPLPEELQQKWTMYRLQLPLLNTLKISRQIRPVTGDKTYQLHGFADASQLAYGACIYLRTEGKNGITTNLICAESRVAPTKKTTIARLELCAAQLLVNLISQVKGILPLTIEQTFLWTDSTIVLQWISSPSSKFTTFVANRVSSIQSSTGTAIWQHVESKDNPADIISRGMLPAQLIAATLWFKGPSFLCYPIRVKPAPDYLSTISPLPEIRRTKFALSTNNSTSDIVQKIHHKNNFQRLQEVLAFIIRFTSNCRTPKDQRTTCKPTPMEMKIALKLITRSMQAQDFASDLDNLHKNKTVNSESKIKALAPFLDDDGILRVGGRIQKSNLPFRSKHPMIISSKNLISKLIFEDLHRKYLHAGPQTLLYISRQTFWCTRGADLANTTVRQCVRCARAKPKTITQLMGNLPGERIQQSRPFLNTGIDFCGPVKIHFQIRGKQPVKTYVAVFVCFATKAVHLELASDLTAAAFIGSLKRFVSRRGLPAKIFCDNATNFVGARSELQEVYDMIFSQDGQNIIQTHCSKEGIDWLHIPPRSPHFGGLWEAAVKSAKYHLKRLLGNAALTYEQLHTVICQVEAVLNSRPLMPLSCNPNDLQALTPGHFLIGQPLSTLPEPSIRPESLNLVTRWKLVQTLHVEFWQRWSKEYLQTLQNRYKWQKPQPELTTGTLVLLKENNTPPLQWRMARVIKTIPGSDNHKRVVRLKTSSGECDRAIHSLCPLPESIITPAQPIAETIETANDNPPKVKLKIAPVSSAYPTLKQDLSKRKTADDQGKQSKKGRFLLSQTLLCVLLVMPLFKGTQAELQDSVEITPFTKNPGIYFEDVGSMYLTHNSWKIVSYYDLSGYWTEYEGMTKSIQNLMGLCSAQERLLNVTNVCNAVVMQLYHVQLEIQKRNELLYQHQIDSRRKKRSPFNIIGSVAHSLFGILDEEFAQQYEEDIQKTNTNEQYLLSLFKNQTSIIDTTVHIFKKTTDDIERQIHFIQSQIDHLASTTRKIEEISQIFNGIALQTTLMVNHLQNTQNTLLEIITSSYHGKINPLLLGARELNKQIRIMREHLPPDQAVPVPKNSPLKLYNLARIQTRTTGKNILFDIRIPLISPKRHQLLKLYPIPIKMENSIVQVQPSSDYLAVTLQRGNYYPLSDSEKNKCQHFESESIICIQSHPLYTLQSDVSKCEMSLLTHSSEIASSCKVKKFATPTDNYWIQLESKNSWIFSVLRTVTLDIVCQHTIHMREIKGSGILKLPPNCIINQKSMIITGHNQFIDKTNFSFAPIIDLANYTFNDTDLSKEDFNSTWTTESNQIEQLRRKLREQLSADLPERLSAHDTHNYVINYITLSILLIVFIFYIQRRFHIKFKNKKAAVEILSREFKVAEDVK